MSSSMRMDAGREVSVFESTIRILGGLLSAYHLTNDSVYVLRAEQLGDGLLTAFDTASGIPWSSVDLVEDRGFNPRWSPRSSSTSEAASIQLELNYLSVLTGDPKYAQKARRAQHRVVDAQNAAKPPLLRRFLDIEKGTFTDRTMSFGSRIDSAYEYYLKVPLQLGRHRETEWLWTQWKASIATAEEELFQHSMANDRLYVAQKEGRSVNDQFDHLVCFLGGALALSSVSAAAGEDAVRRKHLEFGRNLTESCWSIYEATPSGLAPEIVYFSRSEPSHDFDIHSRDKHNLLRPETVESLFYLFRITHDEKYRVWGYRIFCAFRQFTKMEGRHGGYGSINDVTVSRKEAVTFRDDKMESFFLAETLKYLFLLFADHDVVALNDYVFNTEGHPLPVLNAKDIDWLFQ